MTWPTRDQVAAPPVAPVLPWPDRAPSVPEGYVPAQMLNDPACAEQVGNVVALLRGEKGDRGDAGPASGMYEHQQPVAATPWVCNHNLGFRPNVQVFSVGGLEVIASSQHVSANQVNIYFDSPFAGFAIFS